MSRVIRSVPLLFLILAFAVGCASIPWVYEHNLTEIDYDYYAGSTFEEDLSYRMWQDTNGERVSAGLHELQWDTRLAEIALMHTEDMIERGFYEHVNPDLEHPTDRARRYGYPLRKYLNYSVYSEGVGENLGQVRDGNIKGFRLVQNTTEDLSKAQVQLWMNSPKHRDNILNHDYDKMGIATVWNGSLYLTTQVFW